MGSKFFKTFLVLVSWLAGSQISKRLVQFRSVNQPSAKLIQFKSLHLINMDVEKQRKNTTWFVSGTVVDINGLKVSPPPPHFMSAGNQNQQLWTSY